MRYGASVIHPDGYWVPTLFPKQLEHFNETAVYQLCSGPVMSSKSISCENAILKHLWNVPGARFAAFAKTVKSAKHGGSYSDLIEIVMPEWLNAGLVGERPDIRFEYTQEPKVDGSTRTHLFRIRNRWGGESEFLLFSLDCDADVEAKLKNTRYSGMWFIELSNFGDENEDYRIWRVSSNRLRMPHLKPEQHLWLADTNPSDEGEDSWIHKLFYQKRGLDPVKDEWMIKNLKVIEFKISDNLSLTPTQVQKIHSENRSDPQLFDRNVNGLWVASSRGGHFSDVWLPNIAVRGDVSSPNRENWEIIIPDAGTIDFYCGWDPGDVHTSFHIAVKRVIEEDSYAYSYIDELANLGKMVSLEDFVDVVMQKLALWERIMLEEHGVKELKWHHYSDSSAFNPKASINGTEASLIYLYSRGKIKLQAVDKPKGSKRARVNAWRRLLFTQRLFISAQLTNTLKMVRSLRKGSSELEFISEVGGWRHLFDSASYIQSAVEPFETISRMVQYGKRRSGSYLAVAA